MFTGIIERTGSVASVKERPGGRLLSISFQNAPELSRWEAVTPGESIAVDGACLTAVGGRELGDGGEVSFAVVPETLARTTLGHLRPGDAVNLERSLAVGDRFGGHYVTGHIDGAGKVRARRSQGDQELFEVSAPPELLRQIIPKGSIAVDGISLTVIDVDRQAGFFSFAAIPHTLHVTTLGERRAGAAVNLETDAFGKWVLHAMEEISRADIASPEKDR